MTSDLGATLLAGGGVRFAVWAPRPRRVDLRLVAGPGAPRTVPMALDGDVWSATVAEAGAGTEYFYLLDGSRERPDPRSRRQPRGVHGPSMVVDPAAFGWTDGSWTGLDLRDLVIYEFHVGTFTPEGTFEAVIPRLRALRDLGVTAIEPMPASSFPGRRGWGYDGVHPYAPHEPYGGPEGLRRLVDAAHAHDIAVVMDVVYNHLGPEGNYLREFGPYFTDRYKTPWGEAMNYDGPDSSMVRRWVVENALMWLREYHIDALRLDAIHGIFDRSDIHILRAIGEAVRSEGARTGRRAHAIAESAFNDARVVRPVEAGGAGLDAQWLDDLHHALRTALTRDRRGYLAPFGSMAQLARALTSGFVERGTDYRTHEPLPAADSSDVPGERFVAFIQNHDQVANASAGRRLADLAGLDGAACAAVVCLSAPYIPLLFMGEEWGETNPFHFFVEFGDANLMKAVRDGRAREMRDLGFDGREPDPTDPATFEASRPDWSKRARPPHAEVLALYRDLLRLRRTVPALRHLRKDLATCVVDEEARTLVLVRGHERAPPAVVVANLGDSPATVRVPDSLPRLPLALRTAGDPPSEIEAGAAVSLPPRAAAVYAEARK